MNKAGDSSQNPFSRLAGTIADIFAEWSYAQRRLMQLMTAPDRYLPDPDAAPDTYAEFLFRTSGVLEHEPSAGGRGHSRR